MCLVGNLDSVILAQRSPWDARSETLRCLHEGLDGAGYVLATGVEVPADAKLGNARMIVEAVEKRGRY